MPTHVPVQVYMHVHFCMSNMHVDVYYACQICMFMYMQVWGLCAISACKCMPAHMPVQVYTGPITLPVWFQSDYLKNLAESWGQIVYWNTVLYLRASARLHMCQCKCICTCISACQICMLRYVHVKYACWCMHVGRLCAGTRTLPVWFHSDYLKNPAESWGADNLPKYCVSSANASVYACAFLHVKYACWCILCMSNMHVDVYASMGIVCHICMQVHACAWVSASVYAHAFLHGTYACLRIFGMANMHVLCCICI